MKLFFWYNSTLLGVEEGDIFMSFVSIYWWLFSSHLSISGCSVIHTIQKFTKMHVRVNISQSLNSCWYAIL